MREMSEPRQLALIQERNSCVDKGESGQSLSCTSTAGVRALSLLQAARADRTAGCPFGVRQEQTWSSSSAPPCQGVLSVLCFSFGCWLGLTIPAPVTSLKLRQGVDPSTTSFCFAGDHNGTLRAGSIFSFPSE